MDKLDKTLAEQLQINEVEIAARKKYLDFTDEDAALLQSYKPLITRYIDGIVQSFYGFQLRVPEIELLIGDSETFRRLQSAMHRYILEMFDGYYDMDYVNKRLRVGKVHQRIGVAPKYYLMSLYNLKKILNNTLLMHSHSEDKFIEREKIAAAINKIMIFDEQLVFDAYLSTFINQAENAKQELNNYTELLQRTVNERTQQLKELSMRDNLTGLYNQGAFYEHLRRELSGAERYFEPITLFYFDLNGFKKLNDSEGHQSGDEILKLVAQIIKDAIRVTDIACRYGGDEFCIILPRTNVETSEPIKDRLVKGFKDADTKGVFFSLGIVDTGPDNFVDYELLVKRADQEMYKAKAESKEKKGIHISIHGHDRGPEFNNELPH